MLLPNQKKLKNIRKDDVLDKLLRLFEILCSHQGHLCFYPDVTVSLSNNKLKGTERKKWEEIRGEEWRGVA